MVRRKLDLIFSICTALSLAVAMYENSHRLVEKMIKISLYIKDFYPSNKEGYEQ